VLRGAGQRRSRDAADLVAEPVVVNWRRQALLWQSQLDPEDRKRMWQTLRVAWRLDTDPTRLEVRVEDGADISVYESLPWPPELRPATRKPGDLARGMAPDVSVRGESRMGRSLRRSAFVQTAHEVRECLYDLMPYWQHVGTPSLHLIDDEPVLVSEAALFLQLLLASPAEQPREQRAKQYEWALTLTSLPRQRDLLIRQLAEEAPRFSAASLHRILSSVTAGDVERNQSALVETLSAVAARAQDGRELAGSLMGAIGWELADRRDNPVREQLAVLVLGGSGEGCDYTTQP
jgi:hypothetical protein